MQLLENSQQLSRYAKSSTHASINLKHSESGQGDVYLRYRTGTDLFVEKMSCTGSYFDYPERLVLQSRDHKMYSRAQAFSNHSEFEFRTTSYLVDSRSLGEETRSIFVSSGFVNIFSLEKNSRTFSK